MFTNNLIAGAAGQGGSFYPFPIDQSLRFNDNDSAYLSRTPASAGNRKTWTWSGWVKRGAWETNSDPIFTSRSSLNFTQVVFGDIEDIIINHWTGSPSWKLQTNALFRDASAWYHIVISVDTTQATSTNRVKLYVNGEQVTSFSSASYPSQNQDLFINSTQAHYIGSYGGGEIFDGYMAEINFIDGQALDPTSFGEFKSGVWVAKEYTGSYGTNGFRLSFADSSNIGDDTSGNTNDWTANNLAATDVLLDSPTNNFAVLNPLANAGSTFSEGNLQISFGNDGSYNPPVETGTISIPSSGKYYFEAVITSSTAMGVGIQANTDVKVRRGSVDYGVYYVDSGNIYTYVNGSGTIVDSSPATFTTGDVIGVAYDADANSISWYKNGTLQTSYTPSTGHVFTPAYYAYASTVRANFGQDSSFAGNKTAQGNTDDNGIGDFFYPVPSGYLALCSANLSAGAIDPAQDDVPSDYFGTVLYSGDGTTPRSITGLNFQPDFNWIKSRNAANHHQVSDAVRGATNVIYTSLTNAEAVKTEGLQSFDTNGFTVGNNGDYNQSGRTYVAWNWLAGNGTSSNTDGSITSTVSVNQKAGFSVVSYTGTGSNATVGHGLGAAPSVIIIKRRNDVDSWVVYHKSMGNTAKIYLNLTNAQGTGSWQSTSPTSSVWYMENNAQINASGSTYIAYCFAEVEGYSKFGSFGSTNSTDGPFVYCGFRPALVIYKATDYSANWEMIDATRNPYNVGNARLFPSSSSAESTTETSLDLLSNGFKVRDNYGGLNLSGNHIFLAFAEMPFRYSNAR